MSVLIKGGGIITAADDYVGDVFIDNGTVSLIGESLDVVADKTIDATGKYVLPGAIDPHTHIEMFFGGTVTCDDFTSGTVSAAFGGTTTLVDFCMQAPGDTFARALEKYHEKIERCKPVIDVGFHIGITDLHTGGTLEDLARLPEEGVTSYKLFMAYKGAVMVDDDTLFRAMLTAAESGALVMVHAENGDAIDIIVRKAVEEGKTEPIWHARTRPMETEAEATNRAVQLSRVAGGPLYVLHHFGVGEGRISLNRFVELTSTNVAKLFGLYPRKGTIAPGSDADIVVWDPDKKLTISAESHHSNVNYNLFEGTEVTGAPEVVLLRGQVVVENDEFVAQPGLGEFV